MKVLAILQNQWFKEPARMRAILEHGIARGLKRHDFIMRTLFMGCRTGRVLKSALGEEWCRRIVWEEASPEIGDFAASRFPADPVHLRSVIDQHNPDVVLALGKIASDGLVSLVPTERLIIGPHPVARGVNTVAILREIRARLDDAERVAV